MGFLQAEHERIRHLDVGLIGEPLEMVDPLPEPIEEGALDHESADFLVWKNSLSRKIEPTENARPARKEQAIADVPLVSHMSIAM